MQQNWKTQMYLVVEHMTDICDALGLITSTTKYMQYN